MNGNALCASVHVCMRAWCLLSHPCHHRISNIHLCALSHPLTFPRSHTRCTRPQRTNAHMFLPACARTPAATGRHWHTCCARCWPPSHSSRTPADTGRLLRQPLATVALITHSGRRWRIVAPAAGHCRTHHTLRWTLADIGTLVIH
jgi:hypothetical protein